MIMEEPRGRSASTHAADWMPAIFDQLLLGDAGAIATPTGSA